MKEFIIFVCTNSIEIFSKLRSAGLNYNLPSFSLTYCAGVSNKHCLLTFFTIPIFPYFFVEGHLKACVAPTAAKEKPT